MFDQLKTLIAKLHAGMFCVLLLTASTANAQQVAQQPKCAGGPVYMVVSGLSLDGKRMGAYARALAASGLYPKNLGYYVGAIKPLEVFEGKVPGNHGLVIARFPSLDAARSFWYSEEYQKQIKPIRENPPAGTYTVAVYKQAELPDYMKNKVGLDTYKDC